MSDKADKDRNWRNEREKEHARRRAKQQTKFPPPVRKPRDGDDHLARKWDRLELPDEFHDLDD